MSADVLQPEVCRAGDWSIVRLRDLLLGFFWRLRRSYYNFTFGVISKLTSACMCPHLCHFSFITRSFLHPIWIIIFGSKVVEILIILMKLTQSTPVKVPGLFVRYHCARFKVPLPMSADCGGVLEERRSLSVVYAYSSYADARNHAIHD